MRMPPNVGAAILPPDHCRLQWRAACACRRIWVWLAHYQLLRSLQWRAACACRRIRDTATDDRARLLPLQWRAACACRRITGPSGVGGVPSGSPFNGGRHAHAAESPNNQPDRRRHLQWRAACACRRIWDATRTSVTGLPSMEGGMRMPPNPKAAWFLPARRPFNGGRHAHAAESVPHEVS